MKKPFNPEEAGWKACRTEGFYSTVGTLWTKKKAETWEYGLQLESRHENPLGIAHGGVLVTFMDQAVSMIAWSEADRMPSATVQLDSHFLAPAKAGDFVVARVEVTRKSASLIFLRGTLSVEERAIMTAQGLMKIVRRSTD